VIMARSGQRLVGREMAGAGDLQHRIATRSHLGHLREEMGARNLLILIKEVFPDFTEIILLEPVVVIVRRIHGHDLLKVVGFDRVFGFFKDTDGGLERCHVDFDHRTGWRDDDFSLCCPHTDKKGADDHEMSDGGCRSVW